MQAEGHLARCSGKLQPQVMSLSYFGQVTSTEGTDGGPHNRTKVGVLETRADMRAPTTEPIEALHCHCGDKLALRPTVNVQPQKVVRSGRNTYLATVGPRWRRRGERNNDHGVGFSMQSRCEHHHRPLFGHLIRKALRTAEFVVAQQYGSWTRMEVERHTGTISACATANCTDFPRLTSF